MKKSTPLVDLSLTWKELLARKHKFVMAHKKVLVAKMEELWNKDEKLCDEQIVRITRWAPPLIRGSTKFALDTTKCHVHAGVYEYGKDVKGPNGDIEWFHVNFADRQLFGFYGGSLLAQDELQALEIPFLAFAREYLKSDSALVPHSYTEDETGPTPVIVHNVPRLGALDLKNGELYGNKFRSASRDTVVDAFQVASSLSSAPCVNIIAMASLRCKKGPYESWQIKRLLEAAIASFCGASACVEKTVACGIQTGFWGCGAFGGDRVMMLLIQVLAANIANVPHIVLNVVDNDGKKHYKECMKILNRDFNDEMGISTIIEKLVDLGCVWGKTDGN